MGGVLICVCGLALPARADRATGYYKHGRNAELHKQYEQAYADFRQAEILKPENAEYILAARRARFEASTAHIQRGEQLRDAHRDIEAVAEFNRALALDPTNVIAQQELERLQAITTAPAVGQPVTPKAVSELDQRLARAAGPADLGVLSATPITLKLTGDARVAYDTLGKLAGLNVIYDSDFRGQRVSLDLQNVSLLEALHILGIEAHAFYTVVTPDTIFVAEDTASKHNELERVVVKTIYAHNVNSPNDLSEMANAVRTLLNLQHFQVVGSQMALIIRDTPDRVAVAEKLIDDLDKAPPEVVIDVQVLEVNRDFARDLGLLPPTSTTVSLLQPATTTTSSSSGTPAATPSQFTLDRFKHLRGSDFSVTITPATLNALLSDSRTQTLQTPQLRAEQNQKATLQIGQRIPVATGSFQPGIGGIGINPLVNTQFQYQNVGVNVEITPFVHGDHEVSLKGKIEISSVAGQANIGGIQQPIIGQRVIDLAMIQLQDGQSNVLAGIVDDSDTNSTSGLPGLGSLPLLKYLFSSTHVEHRRDEILIVMTPHIVRDLELTSLNRRELDTGTATNVQLHMLPPASPVTAPEIGTTPPSAGTMVSPASASTGTPAIVPAAPPARGPAPTGTAAVPAAPAGNNVLRFDPATLEGVVGNPFGANLVLDHATSAYALSLQLNYDARMLEVESVVNGGFLSSDGQPAAVVHRDDPATGTTQITVSRPPGAVGLSGTGALVTVTFRAKAAGATTLTVGRAIARDASGKILPLTLVPAPVHIR